MLDREKENFYKMHVYHVAVVKDKYGDIDLDNVADDSSDSSSSEDEEATVLGSNCLLYFAVILSCVN